MPSRVFSSQSLEPSLDEPGVAGWKVDAKYLLKASALLSAVVNCSSLRVKVSGREEPVVLVLKNLQNS